MPGARLNLMLPMPQNYGIDDVAAHRTVQGVEGLSLGIEQVVIPFSEHEAVAASASHGSLPYEWLRRDSLSCRLLQSPVPDKM